MPAARALGSVTSALRQISVPGPAHLNSGQWKGVKVRRRRQSHSPARVSRKIYLRMTHPSPQQSFPCAAAEQKNYLRLDFGRIFFYVEARVPRSTNFKYHQAPPRLAIVFYFTLKVCASRRCVQSYNGGGERAVQPLPLLMFNAPRHLTTTPAVEGHPFRLASFFADFFFEPKKPHLSENRHPGSRTPFWRELMSAGYQSLDLVCGPLPPPPLSVFPAFQLFAPVLFCQVRRKFSSQSAIRADGSPTSPGSTLPPRVLVQTLALPSPKSGIAF